MGNVFGAEFRRVENREHVGKPALAAVAKGKEGVLFKGGRWKEAAV